MGTEGHEASKYVLRRRLQQTEIETETDESGFDIAYMKLEQLCRKASAMERQLEPARKLNELIQETKIYWVTDEKARHVRNDVAPVSYRIALSILDGGDAGKNLTTIAQEAGLGTPHVLYYLRKATDAVLFYSQESETRTWRLTPEGAGWVRNVVLPDLQGKHGNTLFRTLKWVDQRLFDGSLLEWMLGQKSAKVNAQDTFEYSISLLLSSMGFSVLPVGMFSDHFDMIAHSSNLPTVLLCECTTGTVRKKASTLGSAVDDFIKALPDIDVLGVVFTTERVKSTDRKDMSTDRISIVDRDQIESLLKLAETAGKPEFLIDVIQVRALESQST